MLQIDIKILRVKPFLVTGAAGSIGDPDYFRLALSN